MRWTKGLLVPERAASILYRQYCHPGLARALAKARTLAFTNGLAPACRPPLDDFEDLCDLIGVVPEGAAAIHSWMTDRQVFCLVAQELSLVVKVGSRTDEGLANEARLLQMLAGTAGSQEVPSVRWSGHWSKRLVVVTEVLPLAHGWREVTLNEALLVATELSGGLGAAGPLVHGDLTPWNVLRLRNGLGLVDWEHARLAPEPLFDLTHFVVATSSLLGRHSPEEAVSLLTAPGAPGWLHLIRLGLDPGGADALVERYLLHTWPRAAHHSDRGFRSAMLARLHHHDAFPWSPPSSADRASTRSDQSGAPQR